MLNEDNAVKYHYGEFPPKNLKYDRVLIEHLLSATDSLARYDQMLKGLHNSEILLAPMRDQEAIISSRIEGTFSTIDEILKYEADSKGEEGEFLATRDDVIETVLYRRALKNAQLAIEDGYPLSQSLIKGLHKQLLQFGRGASKSPGEYKKEQNYLAGKAKNEILFVPIAPEHLQSGMDTLFDYIENGDASILIRAALTHLEFEALHPFKDGNGRIGRMFITLMLWRFNQISAPHFYISRYFEEHKNEYIDKMRGVSENSDWESWCIFFLEAVKQQSEQNLCIAESITELYEELKLTFTEILGTRWSVIALDYFFTNPIFRNNKFTSDAGIPFSTAHRISRELASKGILRTIAESSGRRPAMYAFEPLLELVRV